MESISSTDRSTAITDSIYEELYPEIQKGLKRIEEKDAFTLGGSHLKSVEIAIVILKNGEKHSVSKELYQHKWSWIKAGAMTILAVILSLRAKSIMLIFVPMIYPAYNHRCSIYNREKAENLVKKSIKELVLSEGVSKEDIVQCAIKVNTADQKLFNRGGYWFNFEDKQETLCDHTFRKVS